MKILTSEKYPKSTSNSYLKNTKSSFKRKGKYYVYGKGVHFAYQCKFRKRNKKGNNKTPKANLVEEDDVIATIVVF